jgi:aminopeptidase
MRGAMHTDLDNYSQGFRERLERYAELVVTHGLNVQPGQLVNISSEVIHRAFVGLIVEAAYRRGASYVNVELVDPLHVRGRILQSRSEYLGALPAFFAAKFSEFVDVCAANLKILGPEYPDNLSDLNPVAVNDVRKATYLSAKRFYSEGIGKSKVHWCVIAAATPGWAEKIFPDLRGRVAEEMLWGEIFKICRVEQDGCAERWREHNLRLKRRAERLTALRIKELRFSGPGTDLTVGLSSRALFKGGTDKTPRGHEFEPNLPTEECFTTPDWRRTEGVVTATRPFYVNGRLIKDLIITFKNGLISGFSCSEGAATLESYFKSDEGANRLGEVALVGVDSPIFESGLTFQEILYDENAACHIAVGSAYKGCIEGGAEMSDEECAAFGCNSSSVHTDIMISNEEVDVVAALEDGATIDLLVRGRWVGEFAI